MWFIRVMCITYIALILFAALEDFYQEVNSRETAIVFFSTLGASVYVVYLAVMGGRLLGN